MVKSGQKLPLALVRSTGACSAPWARGLPLRRSEENAVALLIGNFALLKFGYPKSKEKPLRFNAKGTVLPMSLAATRRLSDESARLFEDIFKDA